VSSPPISIRKLFLYSLILSVVLTALLGIFLILSGRSDWLEVRVLLTALTVSALSICGLACGAYLERNSVRLVPLIGIVFALTAGLLLIIGIWSEPHSDTFWKLTLTLTTLAVAFAHISLLSLARLARRFGWLVILNYFFVFGVAALLIYIILGEPRGNDDIYRVISAMAIGMAAVTVLTPIFHRLSRDEVALANSDVAAIDEEIATLRERIAELEKRKQDLA
jgi:hypothetical protein